MDMTEFFDFQTASWGHTPSAAGGGCKPELQRESSAMPSKQGQDEFAGTPFPRSRCQLCLFIFPESRSSGFAPCSANLRSS